MINNTTTIGTKAFARDSKKGLLSEILSAYGLFLTEEQYDAMTYAKMQELYEERKAHEQIMKQQKYFKKIAKRAVKSTAIEGSINVDGQEYELFGKDFTSEDLFNIFVNEPDMYEKKKRQMLLKQLHANEMLFNTETNRFWIPKDRVIEFATSESRLLRYEFSVEKQIKDGQEVDLYVADNFMVVDFSVKCENPYLIAAVVQNGYEFGGKIWRPVLRSASQARSFKCVFTSLEPTQVRHDLTLGGVFANEAGMVSPARKDAYPGNAMGSSKVVGSDYTYVKIDDYSLDVAVRVRTWDGNILSPIKEEDKTLHLTPTDGQGTIRPTAAARVAYRYGLMSKSQYTYFIANFKGLDHLKANLNNPKFVKLVSIFNKIPAGFQLRPAGIKGFVVMFEHDKFGYDVDFCITKSMIKYNPSELFIRDIDVEILQYSKSPKAFTQTNYQQLQALDLTPEALKAFGQAALDKLGAADGVYSNPQAAKSFLGMLNDIGDTEENFEQNLVSKLTLALDACDDVLFDSYFQTQIRRLTQKYIDDVSIGRIPLEGQYAFIITDPSVLFTKQSMLKAGEYYYNGITDEFVITRSPLIHRSEVAKVKTVDVPQYWFLKDLLIFNPFDDTLPRMGGADTDGDKVAMTKDPVITGAIYNESMPMLYDKGRSGIMVPDSDQLIIDFWVKNLGPKEGQDNIGTITNYATIHRDWALHCKAVDNGDDTVSKLRFAQGWCIDSPKTGYNYELPEELKTNKLPHWLAEIKLRKGATINTDKTEVYTSESPMGQLFDLAMAFKKEHDPKLVEKNAIPNSTLMFSLTIDHNVASVFGPIIKEYERNYRIELMRIAEMEASITLEEAEQLRETVYNRYTAFMESLQCDDMTKAALAYNISYFESKSKSTSFPWITSFKGMIELLQYNCKNNRIFRMPKPFDTIPMTEVYVLDGSIITAEGQFVIEVDPAIIPDGVYDIVNVNGQNTFYVSITNESDYSVVFKKLNQISGTNLEGQVTQFSATGFKYYGLSNSIEALKLIKDNQFLLDIRLIDSRAALYVGNRRIGTISKTEGVPAEFLNSKVKLIGNEEPIGVTKKNTAPQAKQYVRFDVQFVEELTDTVISEQSVDTVADYNYSEDPYSYDYDAIKIVSDSVLMVSAEVKPVAMIIDPTILAHVNTKAPYWSELSLDLPETVKSYDLGILNAAPIKDQDTTTIAEIKVTAHNNKVYTYIVNYVRGTGFVLTGSPKPSASFEAWVYRLTSYTCATKRI